MNISPENFNDFQNSRDWNAQWIGLDIKFKEQAYFLFRKEFYLESKNRRKTA